MTLDSRSLTVAQLCPRRWRIEQAELRGKWHPKTLFDAVLRQAILDLSGGLPKESVALQAMTRFRAVAKSPGLDTLHDPWTLAGDYCACLETQVEALSKLALPALKPGPTVDLGVQEVQEAPSGPVAGLPGSTLGVSWRVSAFQDASGVLHRWATVERADADTLAREFHSWHVCGDMAAARAPLTLHLIELGSLRAGRRHSPWCKTYKHPVVAGVFRFRARTGAPLKGAWKPVWYSDARQDPAKWVDLMESDGLVLIHHLDCKPLAEPHIEEFKREVGTEAMRLGALGDWHGIPRSRPACDWPYACPWQHLCFG